MSGGPQWVPVDIHPCISIPRAGWWQSLPWQPLGCSLLSLCPTLGAHHGPITLSPLPQGGTAPWLCLLLSTPAFRALCRVPGPGMVAVSFGREKGTCNTLCQCWVLPDPWCGAVTGVGGPGPAVMGQGEGGAHSLGTSAGHSARPLPALARRTGSTQRAGWLWQAGASPMPSPAAGLWPSCDASGPPELEVRSALPLRDPHPCSHQGGLASPWVS